MTEEKQTEITDQSQETKTQHIRKKALNYSKTAKDSISSDFSSGGWKTLIKNKYFITFTGAIVLILFIFGGGSSSTPKGTDKEVKNTVVELVSPLVRDTLAPLACAEVTDRSVEFWTGYGMTYEELQRGSEGSDEQEAKVLVDKMMKKTSIKLKNIREDGVQNEVKKSVSTADLVVNGETLYSISYSAQRNSDGDVYVEIINAN